MLRPGTTPTLAVLACAALLTGDGCQGTVAVSSGSGTTSASSSASAAASTSTTGSTGGASAVAATSSTGGGGSVVASSTAAGQGGTTAGQGGAASTSGAGGACGAGMNDCDGSCVSLLDDPMNCGTCGMVCVGDQPCLEGNCGCECPKGFGMCPGDTQCCQTPFGTIENCAFCGDACLFPNGQAVCQTSGGDATCLLAGCDGGFADCDMNAANGCEVDTTSDPANCGTCGFACGPGQTCASGTCQ